MLNKLNVTGISMDLFSGIGPKKIDWKKIKASKGWRIALAIFLPGVIYVSFVLGYFSYLWTFLGIILVLLINEFRLNHFDFVFLGIFVLIPSPFFLFFGERDLALQFSITSFVLWGVGLVWAFVYIARHKKNLHVSHPRIHLFKEPFKEKLDAFLLFFFSLILIFIVLLNGIDRLTENQAFVDQRIVIKNKTDFSLFGNDIKTMLETEGFNNIHLSANLEPTSNQSSDSTFIFYRQDKALADYLMSLMPEPNRKIYAVRDQSLDNADIEIVIGNLQIQTVAIQDLDIRILGTPSIEKRAEVESLLGEVNFVPMWNARDYERNINDLLIDSKVPVILYKEESYIQAKQLQLLFPEALITRKDGQEWFEESDEDILILLR